MSTVDELLDGPALALAVVPALDESDGVITAESPAVVPQGAVEPADGVIPAESPGGQREGEAAPVGPAEAAAVRKPRAPRKTASAAKSNSPPAKKAPAKKAMAAKAAPEAARGATLARKPASRRKKPPVEPVVVEAAPAAESPDDIDLPVVTAESAAVEIAVMEGLSVDGAVVGVSMTESVVVEGVSAPDGSITEMIVIERADIERPPGDGLTVRGLHSPTASDSGANGNGNGNGHGSPLDGPALDAAAQMHLVSLVPPPAHHAEGVLLNEDEGLEGKSLRKRRAAVAPPWGRRRQHSGRVSHIGQANEFQATTTQACGLFPFLAGSGSPSVGVPIGRHMMWGEVVCLDQFGWLAAGLVTNPGVFVLGQPGTGKSSLMKRLVRGMCGYGVTPFILGDLKPDYTHVIRRLGGQVITIGRGLDRINPLDTGPLGQAVARLSGPAADQLRAEGRGRRLNALLALLTLVRRGPISNGEENVLGAVIDLLDVNKEQPTIPDVLGMLRSGQGLDALMPAAEVDTAEEFKADTKELRQTLNLLCTGSMKGVFDAPTTKPIDLDAPGVSVDISRVAAAGDTLVAAAMLSTWAYGYAMIDGASALSNAGLAPQRKFLVVMDELWRALRGSPGLVEHADALTRVNRAKGVADIRATHTLSDLEALPTEEDRAKARGFVERAGVVILAGLPPRELEKVTQVVPLSREERSMVAGWSAPASWAASELHPGRGKYLIKCGLRVGIPVEMDYVGDEKELYNTDGAMALNLAGEV